MKRTRKTLLVLLILALLGGGIWRLKRQFVPHGAEISPFLLASTGEQSSTAPSGRKLYYRFNDAGAAHSGFHHTWCYANHWLTGKSVVASGYSTPAVRKGEEPLTIVWHENDSFSVQFVAGKTDPTISWFSGELP